MEQERLMLVEELREIIPVSKTTLEDLQKSEGFPKARRIGKRRRGWLYSEVIEWIRSRPVVSVQNLDN